MKGTSRLSPIINKSATALASYGYTLDAAGHRLSVSELSGRTVNYGYDSLYRLTSETIASDPSNINGAVNYTYDAVGNRKQITSTLAPVPAGLFNYDANDRFTAGDTYDNDGNTVSSGGIANGYDFENHLIQKGGVTMVYDGDGNRVSKTVAGVTTAYLVDTLNPTGYAQVVYETYSGSSAPNRELNHVYVYGLELLGQTRSFTVNSNSTTQQIYYDYDGHGSVRALTDPNGNLTDAYDYDAFGNLIHSTGTTLNNYLFAGEQFDPDLGLYYNRARYLNVSTGRFWTMDTFEGDPNSPVSLHKYLYAGSDPVNLSDRNGHDFLDSLGALATSIGTLASQTVLQVQTVLTTVYLTLGPAIPLLVERVAFWATVGTAALALAAEAPSALQTLARNLQNYQGKFPAGPGPRGIAVGRATGQNLGDDFPVFDNFDFDTGEATQTFSTTQVSSPDALVSAIRAKVSANTAAFNRTEIFAGDDAFGHFTSFTKSQVTARNYLIATPPTRFSLSVIADRLAQIEAEFGVDDILIQESEAFTPYP